MQFRYFDKPELFTGYIDEPAECDICGKETTCFDATLFYGEDELEAVCPACLAAGKLNKRDIFTNQGDSSELKRQLIQLNPKLSDTEINKLVKQKTTELEKTTPHLISWQDWDWPSADGDYCSFIAYGSKPFFEKIANGHNAKEVFKESIYYSMEDDTDADMLWEDDMPEKEIKNYDDSSQYTTLFYVFKSLHSDKIITIWDCD